MKPRDEIKILVVEDSPVEAPIIKGLLEDKFSAEVETANNCALARQKITEKQFDIITLDYRLPDGDGLQLLEEFSGLLDSLAIIVVTGRGDEEAAARALRLGASGYVVKDKNLEMGLLDAVENILAKKILKKAQEQERLNAERSEALAEISRALFEAGLDYQSVLDTISENIAGIADGGCIIDLLSENKKWLVPVRIIHQSKRFQDKLEETLPRVRYLRENDANFQVLKTGRAFIYPETVETILENASVKLDPDITLENEIESLMILPLGIGDRSTGTITVVRGPDKPAFSENEQMLMREAADRAALTIENARLFNAVERELVLRKAAEAELKKINAELDGYAHTVSHELKGPLSSIMMSTDLIREIIDETIDPGSQEELLELINAIRANAKKGYDHTVGLLALAEAGQTPKELSKVNIREIVDAIVDEMDSDIEKLGIKIEIDDNLGQLYGNPTQINQIFSNILNNAIWHNDNEDPVIKISYRGETPDEGHRYVIRDNGPGINNMEMERIFLPFYKGQNGKTGIGLATVNKLIKVYGGRIKAYNDNGACFEFTINDLTA
ncbi:MAG: response regulator [Actinobacteria bacterium]|nr:response regulator [Actinomycetota bacterium]